MAAPTAALLGVFVAAQAQQPLNSGRSSATGFSLHTLAPDRVAADGSGAAMMAPHAHDTTGRKTSKTKAGARKSAKGGSADRSSTAAPASRPSPSAPAGPSVTPSPSTSGSTANLAAAVHKDIASGNYLLAVGQYLVEHGYSRAAAAGVASCIDGESGGNPESVGSGGGGLIGWTPTSSAAPNSNIITGNPAQDMMTQLGDVLYYNSSEIGQSYVSQLNAISDPVSAADFFSQNFEKPAVLYSDVVPSVAQQIFSELGG